MQQQSRHLKRLKWWYNHFCIKHLITSRNRPVWSLFTSVHTLLTLTQFCILHLIEQSQQYAQGNKINLHLNNKMLQRHTSVSKLPKTYTNWDSNINALLRLTQGSVKGASRIPSEAFKTNVYYMNKRNPIENAKMPEPSREGDTLKRKTSQPSVNYKTTPSFYNEIDEIKDVIQKLAVHINKLELQQESSSACTLKRFSELQDQIAVFAQSKPVPAADPQHQEGETKALRSEVRMLDQKYYKEVSEVQKALAYIKDKLFEKLSGLESTTFQSTRQNDSHIASLENSIKTLRSENDDKFGRIEENLNELATLKYTDVVESVSKIVQEQVNHSVAEMIKNGILEYARKKEDEDYRRLCLIDQRILEVESMQQELNREIDMTKLDAKVAAKKEAVANAKFKEMEESIANLIAEQQTMKGKAETEEKIRKGAMQEYWQKVQAGIKEVHEAYGTDMEMLKGAIRENKLNLTALSEDLVKIKDRTNEKMEGLLEIIERNRRTLESEIEEIRAKMDQITAVKLQMDGYIDKSERIKGEIRGLQGENDNLREAINQNKMEIEEQIVNIQNEVEDKLTAVTAEIKQYSEGNLNKLRDEFTTTVAELKKQIKEESNSRPVTQVEEKRMAIPDHSNRRDPVKTMSFADSTHKIDIEMAKVENDSSGQPATPTLRMQEAEQNYMGEGSATMPTPFITPDERDQLERARKISDTHESRAKLTFSASPDPNVEEVKDEIIRGEINHEILQEEAKDEISNEEVKDEVSQEEPAAQEEVKDQISQEEPAAQEEVKDELSQEDIKHEIVQEEVTDQVEPFKKHEDGQKEGDEDSDGLEDLFPKDLSSIAKKTGTAPPKARPEPIIPKKMQFSGKKPLVITSTHSLKKASAVLSIWRGTRIQDQKRIKQSTAIGRRQQ
eukprot:TRINITY_DN346_c0_g1_i3.p1 TRINITY_DN346_c0_g1~~TRINITY_DN346_c0_g1_i3.p1  ORF type:complete len:900 (+),score=121.79 TRINITY_DN346_c0_g1_i3:2341-5040(+)